MPYANNEGVNIHYAVHGEGEPLVLLHGFTSNIQRWELFGYVRSLKKTNKLILIDLRGHGLSDKPHDPAAYTMERRIADIAAVLNALNIKRAHFFGYSMGGWLAFGMAVHYPDMVQSLIIAAAHPYADSLAAFHGVDGSDPAVFMAAFEQFIGEKISPEVTTVVLQNDLKALAAAARDRAGFEPQLSSIKVPLLMIVGDQDKRHALVLRTVKEINGSQLVVVPGDSHIKLLFSADKLLPPIKSFLSKP